MPANYVLLEKIVVGAAGASSVTFSGIPQTGYTDLVIHASMRDDSTGSGANDNATIVFNGDTANGTYRELFGTGTAAGSGTLAAVKVNYHTASGTGSTANTFGSAQIYIPNYTSSNFKSVSTEAVAESNQVGMFMTIGASLWSSTAAITSIRINPGVGAFVQNSTFYLYGVAKLGTSPAIAPKATGGDTIMTDGTYWYHAFKSSGTFTPVSALSCDVLVVAGGGGGGGSSNTGFYAAGGGAGGVLAFASQSLAAGTGYTATIGGPGAGGLSPSGTRGSNGTNTTFSSLTAAVGGGGGGGGGDAYSTQLSGAAGGSGGGGNSTIGTGGSPTSGQGNAGGTGGGTYQVTIQSGGGGGGAGGVGAAGGVGGVGGGAGGAGTNSVTNWGALSAALTATGTGVSGFIAGGAGGNANSGGGGAAGSGGGGAGASGGSAGGVGVANTGSGGGATSAGGSGLVVIRYAV
jgi:hypothetical protein